MRQLFVDSATETMTYLGETVDGDFDASNAETVTKEWLWNDFFGTDEYVRFRGTVAQPIVQPYLYDGELQQFKKAEDELKQAQAQIDNLPWTMGHPPKKKVTSSDQIRGVWTEPEYNDGQQATLYVPANDTDAVRYAVQNDAVSVGFGGALDYDTQTDEYDAVQRQMAYDHIASVENGRCSPEQGCSLHADSETVTHGIVHPLHDGTDAMRDLTDATRTTVTEEGEMSPKFSQGDWVKWDWSGGVARGRVKSSSTSEAITVSGATRDPSEKGEPAYRIEHYDERDGEFGNDKVAYESNLNTAQPPASFKDSGHSYESEPETFDTEAAAEQKAAEIGCEGAHEMDDGWMPCASHDTYKTATDDATPCLKCSAGPCSCGNHVALSVDSVVDAEHLSELDLTPPQAAQDAAQTALDYRDDTDAMNSTGWSRAEQLASGDELTPADISDGTDGMANWWARHKPHTVTADGDSLKRERSDSEDREYVPKPDDNSWIASKGWGGIPGMNWAMRMDKKITSIREADSNLSPYADADIMGVISYDALMGGQLDESELPSEDYEDHYVFAADTKSDSSYPLVDAAGNLRRGNVKAAWEVYGHADDEERLLKVLAQANNQFANADDYSAPIDDDSLRDAMNDGVSHTTNVTDMNLTEFIDENDLSTDEVIDTLGIDVPDSPSEFYDGEPSVDDLRDDFTAVESLADSKESLEGELADAEDELTEYKATEFRDRAERLAELVDRDVDGLVEQFKDGELTIAEINDKISVAEDAIGGTPTTTNTDSAGEETEGGMVADNDGRVSETEIDRTQGGRYNLSSHDL